MTDTADRAGEREMFSTAELTRDEILTRFLDRVTARGLTLYPAQEEAILEVFAGKNVILNTPHGLRASRWSPSHARPRPDEGRRSFYACPIKALVSEKFFALCREFGPGECRDDDRRRVGQP